MLPSNRYIRDKKGNYFTYFYAKDLTGKLQLIDLLESLICKIKELKSEISNNMPDDIFIKKEQQIKDTENRFNFFENWVVNRYDKFNNEELIYKGYQV